MDNLEFSIEKAQELLDSEADFPVDFEVAWRWLSYSRKDAAKEKLVNNFELDLDFSVRQLAETNADNTFSHYREDIRLTVDCFKQLAMMAKTVKGKEVRKYFIDCEKRLKQLNQERNKTLEQYQNELEAVRLTQTIPQDLNRLETLSKPLAEVLKQTILGDIPRVINQTFTSSDQMQRDLNASLVANRLGLTLNKHLKTLEMIKNIYSPESYNQLKQMYEELAIDYNKVIEKIAVQGFGVSSEVLQDLKDRVAKGEVNLEKLCAWQREIEVLARELEADNLDLEIEVQRQCRLNRTLLDENKALTQANLDLLERLNRLEHPETTNNSKGGLKRLKPGR